MMIKEIFSYEKMKSRLVCRLAGAEKCSMMSDDIVRISYLDVTVIFCIFPEVRDRAKAAGFRVTEGILQFWGVSREEMIRQAFRNTRERYRYIFRDLFSVTRAIAGDPDGFMEDPVSMIEDLPACIPDSGSAGAGGRSDSGDDGPAIYTLVNQDMFNGAVILLFPDLIEEYACQAGGDLVILPSSVNELVCLPYSEELDHEYLQDIVRSVNDTCVSAEEKLSDSVYLYRQGGKRIEILSGERSPLN